MTTLPPVSRGPRRPTEAELRRIGVEVRDEAYGILGCLKCGSGWALSSRGGGRLHRGYWHCPQGCNADLVQRSTAGGRT